MLADLLVLDPGRKRSLTEDLTAQLRGLIARGVLRPGTMLPSSRQLADDLALSRNTVTAAVGQLAAEGYLMVRQGCRPVVAPGTSLAGDAPRPVQGATVPRTGLSSWAASLPPLPDLAPLRPFRTGFGDPREFPHAAWARCLRDAARRLPAGAPFAANGPALQASLRDHLAAHRGVRAEPGQIVILPTARAALTLVAAVVLDSGDPAWIEEPGYPGIREALAGAGARVVPVPVDEHGLTLPGAAPAPKLIVATPSHQFPTGRLMPVARRRDLLAAAEAAGALILEDDYDGEFHFDGAPVPALQALAEADRVVYAGTFSKATTPAIRIGYMVVPRALLAVVLAAQRHLGLTAAPQVQDALALFIGRGHYRAHLRRTRRLYRERRDHLVATLRATCGDWLGVEAPAGGLQALATLRDGIADDRVASRAARRGLDVLPLSRLRLGPAGGATGLLLGFAAWRPGELTGAVARLDAAFREAGP
ncbi:MAG: PLP-dependent aminotransferase family protein [Methylobacterium frigidaeris]